MNHIEELKSTLQNLCNNFSEDTANTAELLKKVLDICTENTVLKSKVEELTAFSSQLITRIETASRESEHMNLLKQQIADLSNKNNELENKLSNNNNSIADLQKQISDKDLKISSLSEEISHKNSELNILNQNCDKLEYIRKNYDSLDIRPNYEKLSDNLKNSLSNVFVKSDTFSLLSSGVQENNILRLYNLLKDRVREGIWDNYEELKEIVKRLFFLYNQGRKEPFVIILPDINSVYNDDEQIAIGRNSYGKISKVLLFGYKNTKGEINKAFVEVS